MKFPTCWLLALAGWTWGAQAQDVPPRQNAVRQNCAAVTPETCALAHALGRGVNMGDMLEAPREGDWGIRLEPRFIDKAATVFKTVRLPVRWSNHAAPTADATLDDFFAERVDGVIDAMLARGQYVIVDMHHYSQLMGGKVGPNEFAVEPEVLETRFVNMWRQIALRYKDRSPRLLFELLNEPAGRFNGDSAAWNALAARGLAAVRESNPTRAVLIGPTTWNAVRGLPKLRLPADRNLIVSIHSYEPQGFTHQGISFMPQFPAGPTCCDAGQRKLISDNFDNAVAWSRANGYPMHVGEFGTFMRADMDSRVSYTRFVRDELEKRGIGWTYWEFADTFGVFDPKADAWIEPLRRALLD